MSRTLLLFCLFLFSASAHAMRTVDVFISDPGQLVQGTLIGHIRGESGTSIDVVFRDDGNVPDHKQGDHEYAARIEIDDVMAHFVLTAGNKSWEGSSVIPESDQLTAVKLRIGPEGGLVMDGGPEGKGGKPFADGGDVGGAPAWPWALFLLGIGAGVGIGARRMSAWSASPLTLLPPVAAAQHTLERVSAVDVPGLLAGPLRDHRIVWLGNAPDGTHGCARPRARPAELVATVNQVGLGHPVALIVDDTARIEVAGSVDPVASLAARVNGRFPVWVLTPAGEE